MLDYPPIAVSPPECQGSVLGRIVSGESTLEILHNICEAIERARAEVAAELAALRAGTKVVDYLARVRWPRVCWVEHKTFGRGTALYRKQLENGTFAVVVDYGIAERTLVIDPAYWVTPIEKLLQVKMQKVKKFTVRDGWSKHKRTAPPAKFLHPEAKTDGFSYYNHKVVISTAPWKTKHRLPACWSRTPQPLSITAAELHQIRAEERERLEQLRLNNQQTGLPTPLTNFCPNRGGYVTQDHTCPMLEHAKPCVDGESKIYPKNTQLPDNRPQVHKVAAAPIKTQRKRYGLMPLMASIFYVVRKKMRDMPKMEDVDVREFVMGDVDNKSYKAAVRHLKARSRWLTEIRIEHRGGPEARSFNSILSESRLFPN